jgi:hypothetical protein
MVDRKINERVTIRDFIEEIPIPFEDAVWIESSTLHPDRLNRLTKIQKTGKKVSINLELLCTEYESPNIAVKLNTKRRYLNQQPLEKEDAFSHFVRTQLDFEGKESLKRYLDGKYLKSIEIPGQDNVKKIPSKTNFSFIKHGQATLVKFLLERESDFIIASNNPALEVELRKVCYVPRFSYSECFRENLIPSCHQVAPLIVFDGRNTIVVSSTDEIIATCNSGSQLEKALKKSNISSFQTSSPVVRRNLSQKYEVKRNMCIQRWRLKPLKRLLSLLRNKMFRKRKFLLKKGVIQLQKSKLPSSKDVIVKIHDFEHFYASIIQKSNVDRGMKCVFSRLATSKRLVPKLKTVIVTLFGMSKRHCPDLFYRTLNDSVYTMFKTFLRNRSTVFGMCKDSFFSTSDTMKEPISGFHLKLDHKLKHFVARDINTYAGVDDRDGRVVIKGLHFPPFAASRKIVNSIFQYLVENPSTEKIDISSIVQKKAKLEISDFYIYKGSGSKMSDYFYFGINEVNDFLYSDSDNSERAICQSQVAEPTLNVRSRSLLGKINVKRYVNEILASMIEFARKFGYLDIINENTIFESDLFLRNFVYNKIFERTQSCNLPGFKLHFCQLVS